MNGNGNKTEFDTDALEADLARLAPLVREGFAQAGPSPAALSRIHAEALRQASRKRGFWRRARIAALAASLALAAGGVCHFYLTGKPGPGEIARAETQAAIADEAEMLLSMQGLDAESCFNPEDEESVWL